MDFTPSKRQRSVGGLGAFSPQLRFTANLLIMARYFKLKGDKMATLQQQLAEAEAKLERLKEKAKKQDTAQKVVIGGMMIAYARKNPSNAKRLLEIMQSELREQDLKRVQGVIDELNLVVGNAELANTNQYQGG